MAFKITNVKISVKTSSFSLNNENLNNIVNIKKYDNFSVFKIKYTYVAFKTNKHGENHINITNIPAIDLIQDAINILCDIIPICVQSYKIDNIIATYSMPKTINLHLLCEQKVFKNIKYNNEKFPGLFIKEKCGTIIVFHSGKIVYVGCKTQEDIKWLHYQVTVLI